jgi:hypothetical protein
MARNTITLKGVGVRNEAIAHSTIKPGMLVQRMTTGKVRPHAGAGQNAQTAFAVENDLAGKGIGTNYSANDLVQFNIFAPGDVVYGWLLNGQNVAAGDFLESAGNGELKKYVADSAGVVEYPNSLVAVALEAVDMSDSDAADPSGRIIVEIL